MTEASLALQQAIFLRLSSRLEALNGITDIFDHVPGNARLPYITIGEDQVRDWSSKSFSGSDHRLTIHLWDRARGRVTTKSRLNSVSALLTDPPLEPVGQRLVFFRFLFADVLHERESDLYHGVIRFLARTAPLDELA